eukprot:5296894-Ditylum_brightwellii.AAC.1
MNDTSKEILRQVGQNYSETDNGVDFSSTPVYRCSPKTELNSIVLEFQKMISHFSGRGSAKVVGNTLIEIENKFD